MDETEAFDMYRKLIDAGYLVVMWTPEEIKNTNDLGLVEDRIIEIGNEIIGMFTEADDMDGGI